MFVKSTRTKDKEIRCSVKNRFDYNAELEVSAFRYSKRLIKMHEFIEKRTGRLMEKILLDLILLITH